MSSKEGKSKKTQKATATEEPKKSDNVEKKIRASEFDVKKFYVDPIQDPAKGSTQYNGFVRYDFGSGGKKGEKADSSHGRCVIVTKPIKIEKGGIPSIDATHRPTDNDCFYFWLNLDQCDGGRELKEKVFGKIDELVEKKINKEGNTDFIVKVGDRNAQAPLTKLAYVPICRMSQEQEGATNKKGEKTTVYERVKVKIGNVYKQGEDKNAPKEIKIQVFDASSEDAIPIKSLADLRQAFPWGCKAAFVLEVNKFWAMTALNKGTRDCGFGVKCLAIYVLEKPERNNQQVIDKSIFGFDNEQTTKAKNNDSESEEESETEADKKSESGSESESESDADKKSESGSESESESESEEETPKKTTKKNKNDSDSESESEKPKKGKSDNKKSNTKKR